MLSADKQSSWSHNASTIQRSAALRDFYVHKVYAQELHKGVKTEVLYMSEAQTKLSSATTQVDDQIEMICSQPSAGGNGTAAGKARANPAAPGHTHVKCEPLEA